MPAIFFIDTIPSERHLIDAKDREYLVQCVEDLNMGYALEKQFLNMLHVVAYYEDIPPESYAVLASIKKDC